MKANNTERFSYPYCYVKRRLKLRHGHLFIDFTEEDALFRWTRYVWNTNRTIRTSVQTVLTGLKFCTLTWEAVLLWIWPSRSVTHRFGDTLTLPLVNASKFGKWLSLYFLHHSQPQFPTTKRIPHKNSTSGAGLLPRPVIFYFFSGVIRL